MVDFIIVFVTLLIGQVLCDYFKVRPNHSFILGFIVACLLVSAGYCLNR